MITACKLTFLFYNKWPTYVMFELKFWGQSDKCGDVHHPLNSKFELKNFQLTVLHRIVPTFSFLQRLCSISTFAATCGRCFTSSGWTWHWPSSAATSPWSSPSSCLSGVNVVELFPSRPNKLEGLSLETLSSQVSEFEGKARANPIGAPLRCFHWLSSLVYQQMLD